MPLPDRSPQLYTKKTGLYSCRRYFQDVQEFVSLSTARSFPVAIRDTNNKVNGKSFMEMFCLNLCGPLRVNADCSEEELAAFCGDVEKFLIK